MRVQRDPEFFSRAIGLRPDRWPSDDRRSRIVFITRRVPQRWVEVLLAAIGEEVADVAVG